MRDAKISASEWIQTLVNEVPKFDEMIISEIRMEDSWIGNVSYGPWITPAWFDTREAVRKLSEGFAFKPSKPPKQEPMGMSPEVTQDRFRAVWPNTKDAWGAFDQRINKYVSR